MSTFSGINTAARALGAAQRGMEVTGQNIANVNTDGYSRQRVEQSASVLDQRGQFTQKYTAGDGVVVNGLTRITDVLAVATARQDSANAQEQSTAATILSGVESALGDTGSTGLSKGLSDLTSSWNDLTKAAGTDGLAAARSLVVSRSQAVVSTITGMDEELQRQYEQLGLQAGALAEQVTTAASNVARLNASIQQTLAGGGSANELADQRDQYLNKLADLTGSRVVNRTDGAVDVFIGNVTLVSGDRAGTVAISNSASPSYPYLRNGAQYVTTVDGVGATAVSGSLKATLDGGNKVLKSQWDSLNTVAQGLATRVNTAYDVAGAGAFFTAADGTSAFTAHSLQVRSDLATAPATLVDSAAGTSDRSVAKAVLGTFDATKASWRTNAANIAAVTESATNRATLASQVSLKSSAVRDGVAGVNIDEEMTNLVAYQHAYSAAARVMSTMDQALDTLLNMVR